MLILVVGGAYQGKTHFAKTFGLPVINSLHKTIKTALQNGKNANTTVAKLILKDCVVVCDEVGCGIIPASKQERDYRENVGRIVCDLAKKADKVFRVDAGIETRIK